MTNKINQAVAGSLFALICFTSLVYGQSATSAIPGIAKLSVDAANSSSPIAVGDNDARVNQYKNIISFEAKNDGTTDNTTALQNAINAGFAVMVPEGIFNFSGTLTLKKDSSIIGVGKKSILRYTGAGAAMREPVGSYSGG